jgi:RimJ/RimL family protein N-acetyltransferase
MTATFQFDTDRLRLRPLTDRDRIAFAAMNADPAVMTYFASPMTIEETDAAIARYSAAIESNGFSFLAAEVRETSAFAGIIGMQIMRDAVPKLPQPAVEIGWRLACEHQGKGYATEGARALVNFAFNELGLPNVVAITAVENKASRHVMEKLGMSLQPELEFDHPRVPEGHPHRRNVLYRLINPHHANRGKAV